MLPATDAQRRTIESYKAFNSSSTLRTLDAPHLHQDRQDPNASPSHERNGGPSRGLSSQPAAHDGVDRPPHAASDATAAARAVVPRSEKPHAELLGTLKAMPKPALPLTLWKLFSPKLKAEGAEGSMTSESICERWAAIAEETKLQWKRAVEEVGVAAAAASGSHDQLCPSVPVRPSA
jgi:hypothetical protein